MTFYTMILSMITIVTNKINDIASNWTSTRATKIDTIDTNVNTVKTDVANVNANVNTVKTDVSTVNTKIGATSDAQNSSTTTGSLFAKINYMVVQISSYLATIYTRLGAPTDSASNGTGGNAHQKLNWFISIFGTTSDTNGTTTTGTVFGKENTILTEVNKIGTTNDTGGTITTGTLMAKSNAILDASGKMLLNDELYTPNIVDCFVELQRGFIKGVDINTTSSSPTYSGDVMVVGDYVITMMVEGQTIYIFDKDTLFNVTNLANIRYSPIANRLDNGYIYSVTNNYTISRLNITTLVVETFLTLSTDSIIARLCVENGRIYLTDETTDKIMMYSIDSGLKIGESISFSTVRSDNNYDALISNGETLLYYHYYSEHKIYILDLQTLAVLNSTATSAGVFNIKVFGDGYIFGSADWISGGLLTLTKDLVRSPLLYTKNSNFNTSFVSGDSNIYFSASQRDVYCLECPSIEEPYKRTMLYIEGQFMTLCNGHFSDNGDTLYLLFYRDLYSDSDSKGLYVSKLTKTKKIIGYNKEV